MSTGARYLATRKIADGGSAEIFLAEQQGAAGFKHNVVLKRVRPDTGNDATYRKMLFDEAQLSMSLRHPNLVEVLDVGESNGSLFLVLELVDGWPLAKLARRGREAVMPPVNVVLYIIAEVCRGLGYAHERTKDGAPLHIVHRDVCPNNVLVSMHGEVKLTDFGIARAEGTSLDTRPGMIRGKPAFMSPEQIRAEQLDGRSDLFSLGTVLYALLTGQHPWPGPDDLKLLEQIVTTDAPSVKSLRPELSDGVAALVKKALTRDRDKRFQSAQEMLRAIEALEPGGRSDLERWLRALSERDGELPISQTPMPPAEEEGEPEWISLSSEALIVPDQTATQQALPVFPRTQPLPPPPAQSGGASKYLIFLFAALVTAGAGLWWQNKPAPDLPLPAERGEGRGEGPDDDEIPVEIVEAALARTEELDADAGEPDDDDAGTASPLTTAQVSHSGAAGLKLSARLVPKQPADSASLAISFDSEPRGVIIRVDKRDLGRTPAVLRFKAGYTYDVWFEADGSAPLRQWLMLTTRNGAPRVTLRNPVE